MEPRIEIESRCDTAFPGASEAESRRASFFRRYAFHLIVGGFILTVSFAYGLSVGLSKRTNVAYAALGAFGENAFQGGEIRRLKLPAGVHATPIGKEMTVNNHDAEIVSFVTTRSARELAQDQMRIWKASGFKTVGTTGARRGIVLAFDEGRNERYSLSVWTVPPALRGQMSGGNPTQGLMSVSDVGRVGAATGQDDGTVPGVALLPGGKGGAVVSSVDPGGRTYSSVYTNPGTIFDNIEFYRGELAPDGWRELHVEAAQPEGAPFEVGNIIFGRGSEQIVLLMTPSRNENSSGERTTVAVTRGPLEIERWRNIR